MTSFLQTNGNCVSVLPDIRVDPHRSSSPSVIQQQQLIKNGSPYSEQHITIVAIEGGIAVGKSTLKNKLATVLQATLGPTCLVVHVDEQIEEWQKIGIFGAFSADPNAYAALFQAYVFSTRVGEFAKAYRTALDFCAAQPGRTALLLLERSWVGDSIFEHVSHRSGAISDMEHRVYIALTSAWRDIIGSRELDLIIWLDTPLDETQRRIKKRGRVDENDLPEPYLIALIQSHRANFDGGLYSGVPVLTIDGSQPFHTDEHIVVDIAQSVLRKVVGKKGSVKP